VVIRQQSKQDFYSRADNASVSDMSANDATLCVCHSDMKVGSIRRQGSSERQYFQAAGEYSRLWHAGKPDLGRIQAADSLQHKGGGYSLFGC
jgi:hypothetical protein